jgi:5'-3' exonuclease
MAAETRRVVLIDLSSLYWAAIRVVPSTQPMSEASNIVRAGIRRCYVDGDLVAICCDEGRSFRKEMAPSYKAQRPEKDAAEIGELQRLKEILVKDGYLLWGVKGFEADDVIATATETAVAIGHEVLICSSDKDLLSLLRPGVKALRTHNWVEVDQAATEARFGVSCKQITDWLALTGDTSDNIPGCKGVGPKTATELLSKFGNLDALYVNLEADPASVAKPASALVKNLNECEAAVRLSRQLVELRSDVPFDFRQIYERREATPLVETEEEEESDDMDSEDIPISRGPGPTSGPAAGSVPEIPAQDSPRADVKEEMTTAPQPAPQTQLTVLPAIPVEFERALEPRDPPGAVVLAKHLFNSRVYSKFPTWESVLATIIRGRAMGISAAASLDVFHVVEGRPYPFAYLLIAMAKKDPDCEYLYCVESSPSSATWETKNRRNPKATRFTYSLEQARAAGLVKPKSGWEKFPEQMLVKFTGATLARREYQEATLGLTSIEEIGSDE